MNVGLKSFFGGFDSRYILDMRDNGDSYIDDFFAESVAYC